MTWRHLGLIYLRNVVHEDDLHDAGAHTAHTVLKLLVTGLVPEVMLAHVVVLVSSDHMGKHDFIGTLTNYEELELEGSGFLLAILTSTVPAFF